MPTESEQVLREILGSNFDGLNEATRTIILGTPPETIRKAHAKLLELGLTPAKIASRAELLGMNPDTIQRNYEFLRRFFSKETILKNPQLLGNAHDTILGSVEFMHEFGINHETYPYVYTTVFRKQTKVLSLARARYGYSGDMTKEEKRELVLKAQDYIRKQPNVLIMNEKTIEKRFAKAA
jgi:hypothetical protein